MTRTSWQHRIFQRIFPSVHDTYTYMPARCVIRRANESRAEMSSVLDKARFPPLIKLSVYFVSVPTLKPVIANCSSSNLRVSDKKKM